MTTCSAYLSSRFIPPGYIRWKRYRLWISHIQYIHTCTYTYINAYINRSKWWSCKNSSKAIRTLSSMWKTQCMSFGSQVPDSYCWLLALPFKAGDSPAPVDQARTAETFSTTRVEPLFFFTIIIHNRYKDIGDWCVKIFIISTSKNICVKYWHNSESEGYNPYTEVNITPSYCHVIHFREVHGCIYTDNRALFLRQETSFHTSLARDCV